jgi:hypothetical protein
MVPGLTPPYIYSRLSESSPGHYTGYCPAPTYVDLSQLPLCAEGIPVVTNFCDVISPKGDPIPGLTAATACVGLVAFGPLGIPAATICETAVGAALGFCKVFGNEILQKILCDPPPSDASMTVLIQDQQIAGAAGTQVRVMPTESPLTVTLDPWEVLDNCYSASSTTPSQPPSLPTSSSTTPSSVAPSLPSPFPTSSSTVPSPPLPSPPLPSSSGLSCGLGNNIKRDCLDYSTDFYNCGAPDISCALPAGRYNACVDSQCTCTKDLCDDQCIDLMTNGEHCGQCNKRCFVCEFYCCAVNFGYEYCDAGQCVPIKC